MIVAGAAAAANAIAPSTGVATAAIQLDDVQPVLIDGAPTLTVAQSENAYANKN